MYETKIQKPLSPTWTPIVSTEELKKSVKNIQSRMYEIIAMLGQLLFESSQNEKENILQCKQHYKSLAGQQGKAILRQGHIALISGGLSLATAIIFPLGFGKETGKSLTEMAGVVNNAGSRFAGTHFEQKGLLAGSMKDLNVRELDELNTKKQGEQSTKQEHKETLQKIDHLMDKASSGAGA